MKLLTILAAGVAATVAAVPADAALLTFTLTGSYNATWQLDSNPVPDGFGTGQGFVLVDQDFDNALFGLADFTFYNGALGGGLEIDDYYGDEVLLVADGPQLYTGTESAPVFRTGTFNLSEYQGTGTYTLNIAAAAGAVPEPTSWALMIGGFGLAGGMMRRRVSKVSYAAA